MYKKIRTTYNLGEKELCLKKSADKQDFLLKN
jgi:hypothetical protein